MIILFIYFFNTSIAVFVLASQNYCWLWKHFSSLVVMQFLCRSSNQMYSLWCTFPLFGSCKSSPDGHWGCLIVFPLPGISGAVIRVHFSISSLVLLLDPVAFSFSSNGPFSWHFTQKVLQYFLLRGRLLCIAVVWAAGRWWFVACAAHCHVVLIFAIMHELFNLLFVSISFSY